MPTPPDAWEQRARRLAANRAAMQVSTTRLEASALRVVQRREGRARMLALMDRLRPYVASDVPTVDFGGGCLDDSRVWP